MKRIDIYIFAIVSFLLCGCIDIKLEDQFSDPDAISSTRTARELLSSAYNSLPRWQMELSILSDDFVPNTLAAKSSDMINLYKWQEKAIDDLSANVWNDYYMTVAIINALLPRLELIETKDDEDALELTRIASEAKALKAMCYLDLLRLYAPVWSPENLESDAIILKSRLELDFLPRSSLRACAEEVENLISDALSVDNEDASVFYFSTKAVQALKTEFLLWKGDWEGVVQTGLPLLEGAEQNWNKSDYENLWSGNASPERIFAPYIFDSFYTNLCYDKSQGDYFLLNGDIRWDDTDVRKEWSEYQYDTSVGTARGLGKYNRMYYENISVRYINSLRYGGVCFDVAEALAHSGQLEQAKDLLNLFLTSYGASPVQDGLNSDELIDRILAEKQKEFVGEGVRLFDLKRLRKPITRKTTLGTGVESVVKENDYRWLFPIPQSEYKYNDNVSQNPQWPYIKTE